MSCGGNCLTPQNLDTALAIHNAVEGIKSVQDGTTSTLQTLCYRRGVYCWHANILEIFDYNAANWNTVAKIEAAVNQPILRDRNGYILDRQGVIGGETLTGTTITAATSLKMVYVLNNSAQMQDDGKEEDPIADAWEQYFLDNADLIWGSFTMYKLAERSFSDEFGEAIRGDVLQLNIAIFLIVIYCAVCLGYCKRGGTRIALAIFGVISVGFAIVATMGLCSAFGQFWTPLHGVLPFLLLGLGVDDIFVITGGFDLTSSTLPVIDRLSRSLAHTGASVAVTSLTDFLAFIIGSSTSLPALRSFCIYAAIGIFFILIFQITMFTPELSLDAKRKLAQRNDVCCCCTGCTDGCCSCWPCNGVPAIASEPHDTHQVDSSAGPGRGCGSGTDLENANKFDGCKEQREDGQGTSYLRNFFGNYLGPFLMTTVGKVLVIVVFCGITGAGIYGCTQIKEDADFRDFMPDGSYATSFLDFDEQYFTKVGDLVGVYTSKVPYWSSHTEMAALAASVLADPTIVVDTFNSWEQNFYNYQVTTLGGVASSEAEWYTRLNTWLAGTGLRHRRDIVFLNNVQAGSATNYIAAAKMNVNSKKCLDSKCRVNSMDVLRSSVDNSVPLVGGDPAPFAFGYLYMNYEQYKMIEDEAFRNIGLACLAIFIMTTLLIPHPAVSLPVFCCVVATICDIVGYMYFWGMKIDSVTVVMLIVSLGLAIDYSAHIGVSYLHQTTGTSSEAVVTALREMGTSVVHGATSTFLAIVVLAGSNSYVFSSFFKQLFLATVLGVAHGVLLLPVLLSLIAPTPRPLSRSVYSTDDVKPVEQSVELGVGVKEVHSPPKAQFL